MNPSQPHQPNQPPHSPADTTPPLLAGDVPSAAPVEGGVHAVKAVMAQGQNLAASGVDVQAVEVVRGGAAATSGGGRADDLLTMSGGVSITGATQPTGMAPTAQSTAQSAAESTSAQSVSPQRRRWLTGGVAAVAVAAGAGWAWHRSTQQAHDPDAAALQALWALQLTTPEGSSLAVASLRGRPLLVNFWATWCPPCVRELPLLDAFAQAQAGRGAAGVQVLGIAVDQAASVRKWLARQPLSFAVAMAGAGGVGLTRTLGNEAGGLPFSLLVDASGRLRQRKMGEMSDTELQQWAAQA